MIKVKTYFIKLLVFLMLSRGYYLEKKRFLKNCIIFWGPEKLHSLQMWMKIQKTSPDLKKKKIIKKKNHNVVASSLYEIEDGFFTLSI